MRELRIDVPECDDCPCNEDDSFEDGEDRRFCDKYRKAFYTKDLKGDFPEFCRLPVKEKKRWNFIRSKQLISRAVKSEQR